ncbi:MAG: hemerythrin domain-containing protein [Rikenellaceae bacterium]
MYKTGKYLENDSMAALICDNYSMLLVMSRFGMPLGVADKSIAEVCQESNVDANTFLAVVNLLIRQEVGGYKPSIDNLVTKDLVKYLRNSHDYYIKLRLPEIRTKLVSSLGDDKISMLILQYFDDYLTQVEKHLYFEEEIVFPYIDELLQGHQKEGFSIDTFSEKHDHVDRPLNEFKDVIIKYYTGDSSDLVSVIHDVLSCANDLTSHSLVEDRLLVPLIRKMER